MGSLLWKRQMGTGDDDNNNNNDVYGTSFDGGDDGTISWWFTPAGYAVRYAVVAILLGSLALFFIGGYYHAKRRLRQGKQPLRYHRWMVRNTYPSSAHVQYHTPAARSQGYPMETYAPPPPAYNHEDMPPPGYQPGVAGSKVMADQTYVPVQQERWDGDERQQRTGVAVPGPVARP